MNSLSNKLSIMIRGSICLLGLVNVGNFLAAPANAQQARATGAAALVRPSGSSISVSGVLTLPSGAYYDGDLKIAPTYGGIAGTNDETITSLIITPGEIKTTTLTNPNPFIDTAAILLRSGVPVKDAATIIQAGAGDNGLGALD
jgi:hypothetical protein